MKRKNRKSGSTILYLTLTPVQQGTRRKSIRKAKTIATSGPDPFICITFVIYLYYIYQTVAMNIILSPHSYFREPDIFMPLCCRYALHVYGRCELIDETRRDPWANGDSINYVASNCSWLFARVHHD